MISNQPASRRFLRLKEVKQRVGLGHTSIYEMMKNGQFPKPHVLGLRAVGWLSDEIDAWIEGRVLKRAPADHQGRQPASSGGL